MKNKNVFVCVSATFIFSATALVIFDYRVALYVLSAGIIYSVFSLYNDRKISRQINNMCADIDKVLHGDYVLKLADYSEERLSLLNNEIHKMTIRLNEQSHALLDDKQFLADALADISHQLKTPLTSINIIISSLMSEELKFEKRVELAGKLSDSMNHIEWLIDTLLKMSKFDAGTAVLRNDNVNVFKLINKCYGELAILMELKNIEFSFDEDSCNNITYKGDFVWSCEAVSNILKNCIEHCTEGGSITVKVSDNTIYTQIVIQDNGTGIDEKDIPHIFERFYKGKNSSAGSYGIGLALAMMIIKKQNGTIAVSNLKGGGAQFVIKIYREVT